MTNFPKYLPERRLDFVSRDNDLQKINELLKENQTVAISAFGGTGKSTLALEYYHRILEKNENFHVRWLNADSLSKFDLDYREFAKSLNIATNAANIKDIKIQFDLKLTEFGEDIHLVLDNMENYQELLKTYLNNLPKNVKLLLTTRDDLRFHQEIKKIDLQPFNIAEAKAYVELNLKTKITDEQQIKIVDIAKANTNEILPLKIELVVAYIKEYIRKFDIDKLLSNLTNAGYHNDKVEHMLFHKVTQDFPDAFRLLQYSSFLDPDFMSKDLLEKLVKSFDKRTFINYDENFKKLLSLSLFTKTVSKTKKIGFKVHRLVQEEIKSFADKNIDDEDLVIKNEIIKNNIIQHLNKVFVYSNEGVLDKTQNEEYYKHVLAIKNSKSIKVYASKDVMELLCLLDKLSNYERVVLLNYAGNLNTELVLYKIETKFMPKEHSLVASRLNSIGSAYISLGEPKKSLEYFQNALDMFEKVEANKCHVCFSDTYLNLGNAYFHLGEYKKAAEYYEKSLMIKKSSLPENDPKIASNLINLGLAYYDLDEFSKAISYYENANEIYQKTLPKTHAFKAHVLNNLGLAYLELGDTQKSIDYFNDAIDMYNKTVPENHASIGDAINNLGLAYSKLNNKNQAINYFKKSLDIKLKTLPAHHASIADQLNNIGIAYSDLKDFKLALEYYKQALSIYNVTLPEDHFFIADCYMNIGNAYRGLEDVEQGVIFNKKSLEMKIKTLGENHSAVASSLMNLGGICLDNGDTHTAIEHLLKSLEILKNLLPEDNVSFAQPLFYLGLAFSKQHEYKNAIEYFEKSLRIYLKNEQTRNQSDHKETIRYIYLSLSSAYSKLDNKEKMIECLDKANDFQEQPIPTPDLTPNLIEVADSFAELNITSDKLIHFGFQCDGCQESIYGDRFKCKTCENFDLCESCHLENTHIEHEFKIFKPDETFFGSTKCDVCSLGNLRECVFVCNNCTYEIKKNEDYFNICVKCHANGSHNDHDLFELKANDMIRMRCRQINDLINSFKNGFKIKSFQVIGCSVCREEGVSFGCISTMFKQYLCVDCFLIGHLNKFKWKKINF